jgi:phosphohistidine phosphatase
MTRTLILLRHAKSAWPADTADAARPLAARGLRDAPAVGRWLQANAPEIDQVVCSPADRAAQTWDLAAVELDATLEDILTLLTGLAEPLKTSAVAVITTAWGWDRARSRSWTVKMLATPRG